MGRRAYTHSAYWYAKNYGYTRSDRATRAGRYADYCTRPAAGGGTLLYDFNPLLFGVYLAMDIGEAVRHEVGVLRDPAERDRMRRELMRDLRAVRRPFYYARETERRRRLAAERRKVGRRSTSAPMPTPEAVLAAWDARRQSREAMVRLGGMLHDLECYVDSGLRFDGRGDVVGRNGGIRGWLRENLPELSPKYKTLMRYKALAVRLRQATGTRDPTPTEALLAEPRGGVAAGLLAGGGPVFSRLFGELEHMLSPETVFLDAPGQGRRRGEEEAGDARGAKAARDANGTRPSSTCKGRPRRKKGNGALEFSAQSSQIWKRQKSGMRELLRKRRRL